MGATGGIIVFLLGLGLGGIIGWVLGVTRTHAKFGIPMDQDFVEFSASEQPSVTLPTGPVPKAER